MSSNQQVDHLTRILLCAFLSAGAFLLGCDNGSRPEVPQQRSDAARRAFAHVRIEVSKTSVRPVKPVATVNGEQILPEALEEQTRRLRGGSFAQEARRELVLQRMIDEMLLRQWLDKQSPAGDDLNTAVDDELERLFGGAAHLERHLRDSGLSLEHLRGSVRQRVRLQQALEPAEPAPEVLETLYTDVTNRPATQTSFELLAVTLPTGMSLEDAEERCAASKTREEFTALPGRQSDLGVVGHASLSPKLTDAFGETEQGCAATVDTPTGPQLFWVNARHVQPTPAFSEMLPLLRERASALTLEGERSKLLSRLRSNAAIQLSMPTTRQ